MTRTGAVRNSRKKTVGESRMRLAADRSSWMMTGDASSSRMTIGDVSNNRGPVRKRTKREAKLSYLAAHSHAGFGAHCLRSVMRQLAALSTRNPKAASMGSV